MTLVIFAAGMGSRFGGLKQVEPVGPNGEFIIDYSVYDAIRVGFTKVIFVIKEEMYEVFKNTIGARVSKKIQVEYAFQSLDKIPESVVLPKDRIKPLGTGQALYCAESLINEPFATITSDDFYGFESFDILAKSLKNKDEFSVIGYKVGNTMSTEGSVKRGIVFEKNGYLDSVIESKVEQIDGVITATPLNGMKSFIVDSNHTSSMLMFGLQPSIFKYMEKDIIEFFLQNKESLETCEYYLPQVLNDMVNKNIIKIKLYPTTAIWKGITYASDLAALKEYISSLIEQGIYPSNLY